MKRLCLLVCLLTPVLLAEGCTRTRFPLIEDLRTGQILTDFEEVERSGIRDGAHLPVSVRMLGENFQLVMSLDFQIGVPTELSNGTFTWSYADRTMSGQVRATSLTFLGGQSDNPNLGGIFELLEGGQARYKVVLPTGEVRKR